jgi:hypothetical protein
MPLSRSRTYLEALENGVSPWRYAKYLSRVFPYDCVTTIEESINQYLPVQGKVFEVEIFRDFTGRRSIDVKQIHFAY